MFDMLQMMGKLKELQEKMKVAQNELSAMRVNVESGGGMVKAHMTGRKQLLQIEIDPTLLNKEDAQLVSDLIVAAVNKAIESAEELAKEHMKKASQGLLPNIPGLDLSGLV